MASVPEAKSESAVAEPRPVLEALTNNDNTTRLQAESRLTKLLDEAPDSTLLGLIAFIGSSLNYPVRLLAAVLLARYARSGKKSRFIRWNNIDPGHWRRIKSSILELLQTEDDPKLLRHVGRAICGLVSLFDDNNQDWPELYRFLGDSMADSTNIVAACTLHIIGYVYVPQTGRDWDNSILPALDQAFLRKDSSEVIMGGCIAVCKIASAIPTDEVKPLVKYTMKIVETIRNLREQGEQQQLEKLLVYVGLAAESEPSIFKKCFPELTAELLAVMDDNEIGHQDATLRRASMEIYISIVENLPELARKHKKDLTKVCKAIFAYMVSIDSAVDPQWLAPEEGYNTDEDNDLDDPVNFCAQNFDRLLTAIDGEFMLARMEKIFKLAIASDDWRYHNAGLYAIGQIGEYCEGVERVRPLIPTLVKELSHPHPKVRFAALYCIGLLVDYMHPEFQNEFGKTIVPAMLIAIKDPVPRVQGHVSAALTNFFENAEPEAAIDVTPQLVPILAQQIRDGISVVKESAVTCLATIASYGKETFIPFCDLTVTLLFDTLRTCESPARRGLIGLGIECLTMMLTAVGRRGFGKFTGHLVTYMAELHNSPVIAHEGLRSYLLIGWKRVGQALEEDVGGYLEKAMPPLLLCTKKILETEMEKPKPEKEEEESENEDEDKKNKINEEMLQALAAIRSFAQSAEGKYAPFAERTQEVAALVLWRPTSDNEPIAAMKAEVTQILAALLKCYKKSGSDANKLHKTANDFIGYFLLAHDEYSADTEDKSKVIGAMVGVITTLNEPFMESGRLVPLFKQVLFYITQSTQRMNEAMTLGENSEGSGSDGNSDDTDDDKENGKSSQDEVETESVYQRLLCELLVEIFRTHPTESAGSVGMFVPAGVPLGSVADEAHLVMALHVSGGLLQHLGNKLLGNTIWLQLSSLALANCSKPNPLVRRWACTAVGGLAAADREVFQRVYVKALIGLAAALEAKSTKSDDPLAQKARDAGMIATERILRLQKDVIAFDDIWAKWLKYMPPKSRKKESAREAIEFVADTVAADAERAVGKDCGSLKEITRIFAKALTERKETEDHRMRDKIARAVQVLRVHPTIGLEFKKTAEVSTLV